jgi:Ser/Thr protein kinase RdoA (MazF antagonist)
MDTRRFWNRHFSAPDVDLDVLAAFVALTPLECADVLEIIGAPRAEGIAYESAENRVFGFGGVVLKFYRPGRWSLAALQDEVQFLDDLRDAGIPFVRPIGGVGTWRGIHYVAYEAIEQPFEMDPETLSEDAVRAMVRLVARIHDVGAERDAPNRPRFDAAAMCAGCFDVMCSAGFLPESLQRRYADAIDRLVGKVAALGEIPVQRIHGDCSSGNALWRADGPVFMDLDDFQVGPIAIDIPLLSFPWRLDTLPAEMDRRERRALQHQLVLDTYREVRPFDPKWEALVPLVRGCRDVTFDAWFSARWNEPGFAEIYDDDDITDPEWWRDSIEGLERAAG